MSNEQAKAEDTGDWSFGFSDFDPSNPFLDDSALLGGLTPEWGDSFLEQAQFQLPSEHHDHSLTSHEASSDDDGDNRPAVQTSNASSATQSHGSVSSTFQTVQPHHENYEHEQSKDAVPSSIHSSQSLLTVHGRKTIASILASRAQTAERCNTRSRSASNSSTSISSYLHNEDPFESGSGSLYGGRGSVTGRRKATEQARSVLMDWLHENRGIVHVSSVHTL